jgi:mono/diheme cytochrome c family protein
MSDFTSPEKRPAKFLAPDLALRPDASDFVEQPELNVIPATRETLPVWLYLICGVALFLAGSSYAGLDFGPGYYDQGMGGASEETAAAGPALPPPTPMSIGKALYNNNCANCHQASGAGQPGSYPPLVGSEWVLGSKPMLAAILLDGVAGQLSVHGGEFGSNVMPAWANMPDQNLADIMTYIRGTWGNTADAATPAEVTAARAKDASRTAPWAQTDLMQMKNEK